MFNLQDLAEQKRLAKITVDQKLQIAESYMRYGIPQRGKGFPNIDNLWNLIGNITRKDEDVSAILRKVIKEADGRVIRSSVSTHPISRTDYFDVMNFYAVTYTIVEVDMETLVRRETKSRLNKMLRPKELSKYTTFDLDCKLMDQFKAGTLTMDQVIEGTLKDCEV